MSTGSAVKVNYLTVQDVLYVNRSITKKTQPFHFATLEEVTYYQYSPGAGFNLFANAERLLEGFSHHQPFAEGNQATAIVSTAAFLALNQAELDWNALPSDLSAISGKLPTNSHSGHHSLTPKEAIDLALAAYSQKYGERS